MTFAGFKRILGVPYRGCRGFLVNPSIRTDMKREESGPQTYIGKDDCLKKTHKKGLLVCC